MPPIIAAVEARATVGEIADAMRAVFGEYRRKRRRSDRADAALLLVRRASDDGLRPAAGGPVAGRRRRELRDSRRAKRSGWSANRAAASRSRRCRSCGWCSRRDASPAAACCFKGRDLLTLAEREMRAVRGAEIALIFQEPMTALNPVFTIGDQIAETLLVHGRAHAARGAAARRSSCSTRCAFPTPARARRRLPAPAVRRHAAARADRDGARVPAVAASSPTSRPPRSTSTIQAQILDLLREMKSRVQPVAAAHHARPRRHRRNRRPRRRHVRRPHRRDRDRCATIFRDPQHPYTRGPARVDAGRRGRASACAPSKARCRCSARCRPAARSIRAAPIASTRARRRRRPTTRSAPAHSAGAICTIGLGSRTPLSAATQCDAAR